MHNPPVDPRFATRERQPGLDLLRALAVILVITYHAGWNGFELPYHSHRFGWIGVDLFFVLSGYLIGGQLLAPLARGQRLDLPRFFKRRALRILPAYLVVLAVYFLFPARREFSFIPPAWKFLAFVQNLGLPGATAFSHAWSLCVEGQFYLVLPFLLLLLARWGRGGIAVPCAVVIGGVALRAALAYLYPAADGPGVSGYAYQTLIYYATWTRLDPLVIGVSLAAIEQLRPLWWRRLMDGAPWMFLPAALFIAWGLYLGENNRITVARCVWQFPLIALGMGALLVCAVSDRLPLRKVAVPGAAFVASIAYSVYLSHKLTMKAMIALCSSWHLALTSAAAIVLNLAAITAIGSLLFFLVERPFLQLRSKKVPRTQPSS